MTEGQGGERRVGRMIKRRARLEDGRYLIYYTFTDGEDGGGEGAPPERPGPAASAEAAEERDV